MGEAGGFDQAQLDAALRSQIQLRAVLADDRRNVSDINATFKELVSHTEDEVRLRRENLNMLLEQKAGAREIREEYAAMVAAQTAAQEARAGARETGWLGRLNAAATAFEGGIRGIVGRLPYAGLILLAVNAFQKLYDRAAEMEQATADISTASGTFATALEVTPGQLNRAVNATVGTIGDFSAFLSRGEAYEAFNALASVLPQYSEAIRQGSQSVVTASMSYRMSGLSAQEFATQQARLVRTTRSMDYAQGATIGIIRDYRQMQEEALATGESMTITQQDYMREVYRATSVSAAYSDSMVRMPAMVRLFADQTRIAGDRLGDVAAQLQAGGRGLSSGMAMLVGQRMGARDPLEAMGRARLDPAAAAIASIGVAADALGGVAEEGPMLTRQIGMITDVFGDFGGALRNLEATDIRELLRLYRDHRGTVEDLNRDVESYLAERRDFTREERDAVTQRVEEQRGVMAEFTNWTSMIRDSVSSLEGFNRNVKIAGKNALIMGAAGPAGMPVAAVHNMYRMLVQR